MKTINRRYMYTGVIILFITLMIGFYLFRGIKIRGNMVIFENHDSVVKQVILLSKPYEYPGVRVMFGLYGDGRFIIGTNAIGDMKYYGSFVPLPDQKTLSGHKWGADKCQVFWPDKFRFKNNIVYAFSYFGDYIDNSSPDDYAYFLLDVSKSTYTILNSFTGLEKEHAQEFEKLFRIDSDNYTYSKERDTWTNETTDRNQD